MAIAYESDFSDLIAALESIDDQLHLEKDELLEIAQRAAFMVRTRTARGIDYRGRGFVPYSTSYARFRASSGRNRSPVDLLFTGAMMASMIAETDGESAIVGFSSASEAKKADWHNTGAGNLPERRFVDFEKDGRELSQLAEMAAEFMARRIEQS